ncbi:hypothetical protein SAMN04488056_101465 [Cohaesibacter marisflavi]|uniref:Uncharacterized protein n=1 Tax=Cohaesibacter marisflavi TaxID=655353 RepID=A0A1I5AF56_9HYPH|nr:hypothetical protein [Cohaesibacter marisflavi]SFN61068.1 hypothetical protein SAMN04488056_101465 [Cohaesibacter marisflavi]
MQINLIPQRRDDALELSFADDVLTINEDALDLSSIPAGATLPIDAVDCKWLTSDIERDADGVLSLSLILPLGFIPDPTTDEAKAVLYPDPLEVTEEGAITLPSYEATGATDDNNG